LVHGRDYPIVLCRFYSSLTGPSCGVGYWTGEEAVFRGIGEPKA